MTPTTILLVWLAFILLEVFRNWYMIEIKKMAIDHVRQAVIRSLIGIVFWICSAIFSSSLEYESWLFMPVMMALTFWNIFDIGLNLARGKSIGYFGAGSKLDRIQSKWPEPWVIFKLLFGAASITVYYKLPDLI